MNFSSLRLHTQQLGPVGAPSEARVSFSLQGEVFSPPKKLQLPEMEGELELG